MRRGTRPGRSERGRSDCSLGALRRFTERRPGVHPADLVSPLIDRIPRRMEHPVTVDDGISNPSSNRPFQDVLATNLSRRKALIGGGATAAIAFFGTSTVAEAGAPSQGGNGKGVGKSNGNAVFHNSLIGFAPCPIPADRTRRSRTTTSTT